MDAHPHGQPHASFLLQPGVQEPHGLQDAQSGSPGALGIVLVRLGIAKVHQQAIAQILRNIPVKALDHLGAGLLVRPHDVAPVFRIELPGQAGRVHQVAEQHRELPALGLGHVRRSHGRCGLGRLCMRRVGRGLRLGEARSGLRRRRVPSPDQDSALLVTGQLFGRDDFVFQVFEVVVVQVEPAFEGPVRHPPLTPEQVKHLGQELIKGHDWPSPQQAWTHRTGFSAPLAPHASQPGRPE